ncbi:hypothetical protein DCF83_08220 [Edwardsiella tarda]|uniref:hypothetical protein n=1 Tax=Edwardsiella tarda TaxID=636 RepID=UPI002852B6C7|nr:hypothetical protein [Edwardsiella tarda]UCQ29248.1 hypothetical protein DCF83_08220 [Edwardsiella tarda]
MSRLAIFPLLVLLAGLLPLAAMLPATLLPLQQRGSREHLATTAALARAGRQSTALAAQ